MDGHIHKYDLLEVSVVFLGSEEASLYVMSFLILIQMSLYLVGILYSLVCGCSCVFVLKMVFLHILFSILVFLFFFFFKRHTLFNLKFRTKFIGNQMLIYDATLRFVSQS